MKITKINKYNNATAFVLVYGAAGLSFLATLIRDYIIIQTTPNSAEFFKLFYVASMSSGFAINAVTLGGGVSVRHIFFLSFVCVFISGFLIPREFFDVYTIAWVISVQAMWIVGAFWSRLTIEHRSFFWGRSRELVTSLFTALLLIAGFNVKIGFLCSVIIGTMFSWMVLMLIIKYSFSAHKTETASISTQNGEAHNFVWLIKNIVLSNLATFIITFWALKNTNGGAVVFGIESTVVIRISLYIYQAITIGSVVFVVYGAKYVGLNVINRLGVGAVILLIAGVFLPLEVSVIILPILAGVMHYCLIISLQGSESLGLKR